MITETGIVFTILMSSLFLGILACNQPDDKCKVSYIGLDVTASHVYPPLTTSMRIRADGAYTIYRNRVDFDTIRGHMPNERIRAIRNAGSSMKLPVNYELVSDAGLYTIEFECNGEIQRGSYEGLDGLPDDVKVFISSLEDTMIELGTLGQD